MSALADTYFPLGDGFKQGESSRHRRQLRFVECVYKFLPIAEWLPAYRWRENGATDLAAGATLGCILVAESLAHADLCKVMLIQGPYSCIIPPIVYSLFGTCVHSSVGTGGLVSLLIGEQLANYGNIEQRTHASAIFTLLVGLVLTLMGVFRLAFLVRFLSRPALSGFITASAVLIVAAQFKPMMGLPKADAGGLLQIAIFHPGELEKYSSGTVILSILSVVFLTNAQVLSRCHRNLKFVGRFKELILLGVSAIFASKFCHSFQIDVVGDVPSGLPSLAWPLKSQADFDLAKELLPDAVLVALVTFLSSFAGAKKFAMKAGYQVVALNELLALGFANLTGAFCGAVPTQIGLSRMGIAHSAGVKSQLGANIYVGITVAVVLQLFSSYLYFVPRCVLNAIMLNGASHLTEFDHMLWLWSLRSTRTRQRAYLVDFAVWWAACLSTLYLGALFGILFAVGLSLVLIIYQVSDPPITILGWSESHGRWLNVKSHDDAKPRAGILAFRVEGPLFYANIERIQEWLAEMEVKANHEGQPVKACILSVEGMPLVDTTALEALRQTIEAYRRRNVAFLVANAAGQPQRIFQHALDDLFPESMLVSAWNTQECFQFIVSQESQKHDEGFQRARTCTSPSEAYTPPVMPDSTTFLDDEKRDRSRSADAIPLMRSSTWVFTPAE